MRSRSVLSSIPAAMAPMAIISALALGGCHPQAPDGSKAAPPADAPAVRPVAFTDPLDLTGTEPTWTLKVRPQGLTLSRPDLINVTAPNTAPVLSGDQASWTTGVGEAQLTVTVTRATCVDRLSGTVYPLTAQVTVGRTALTGCGARAGEAPTPAG